MQHRDEVAMEDKMLTRDRQEDDFISRLLLHYFLFSYIYLFIYLFFQFVAIVFVLFFFLLLIFVCVPQLLLSCLSLFQIPLK